MNRIVVFGLALFFALVGIALVGSESKALAFGGHRCNGCNSCNGCNGCHSRCHGGCHSRCHSRCHGRCHGRCNGCNGGCCGGGYVQAPEKQAPAPAQAPAK